MDKVFVVIANKGSLPSDDSIYENIGFFTDRKQAEILLNRYNDKFSKLGWYANIEEYDLDPDAEKVEFIF